MMQSVSKRKTPLSQTGFSLQPSKRFQFQPVCHGPEGLTCQWALGSHSLCSPASKGACHDGTGWVTCCYHYNKITGPLPILRDSASILPFAPSDSLRYVLPLWDSEKSLSVRKDAVSGWHKGQNVSWLSSSVWIWPSEKGPWRARNRRPWGFYNTIENIYEDDITSSKQV